MKKNDVKLIIVLILITGFLFMLFNLPNRLNDMNKKNNKNNYYLVISVSGKTKKYLFNKDRIIKLKNKIKIQIKNKKAKIIFSPCKNKICEKRGYISKLHENIVCLPCKTIVYIEKVSNNNKNKFDSFVE